MTPMVAPEVLHCCQIPATGYLFGFFPCVCQRSDLFFFSVITFLVNVNLLFTISSFFFYAFSVPQCFRFIYSNKTWEQNTLAAVPWEQFQLCVSENIFTKYKHMGFNLRGLRKARRHNPKGYFQHL